jgi:hypothetical protein
MIITYEVEKVSSEAAIISWGCFAKCCISAFTGSNGTYF